MSANLLLSGDFLVFATLAIVTLVSTWRMVTVRLITHAALFMALSFTAVAGIFLQLQAEFVAAIQVLIYAGAITTMVIFAIMLSGLKDIKAQGKTEVRAWRQSNLLVFVVGFIFAAFMVWAYVAAGFGPAKEPLELATVSTIGTYLFTTHTIPFEIASVLLLIAMVGAIILTAKEVEQE